MRLIGDFDLAEEALHEAFRAALEQWPSEGVPANPRAWLVGAGRFKAIDSIRRQARFDVLDEEKIESLAAEAPQDAEAGQGRLSPTRDSGNPNPRSDLPAIARFLDQACRRFEGSADMRQ